MSGMDRLTELLPCPFCGGTEADGIIERAHGSKYVMHSESDDCAAFRGVLIPTQHWNRRASRAAPAPSDGLREAAQQMLIEYDEVEIACGEPSSMTAAVLALRAALTPAPAQEVKP